MAEREGFEPSVRFLPYTRLAGVRLKPARPPLHCHGGGRGTRTPKAETGGFQDRCITNYTIPPNSHYRMQFFLKGFFCQALFCDRINNIIADIVMMSITLIFQRERGALRKVVRKEVSWRKYFLYSY